MEIRFLRHDTHLDNPKAFDASDHHLKRLREQPLAYRAPLLDHLPHDRAGIYTLGGGRQVGKTTLVKQWKEELSGKESSLEISCI